MENSFINLLLVPEIALSILTMICLMYGVFLKKNAYVNTLNFSILSLILILFLIYFNFKTNFAQYNIFFKNSSFVIFFKYLIILGSLATLIISKNYFIEMKLVRFEIPILILFSTLGMLLMISANDLMSMYLSIELQSLSLYVLAAIKRDSLLSSEAGVKYFVLGALSSGILLYGFSLIYGFTGSTSFDEINLTLFQLSNLNLGLTFGLVFILVGLAFKVSAVPFHMWTPDVYEGSPTSVTAFFAIVPKIAAICLIFRLCLEPFKDFYFEWSQIIIFLSIASMYLGAIAAIAQKNIKRLLAYSSIGHVGYLLIALVVANQDGVKALIIYTLIYLIMNIAVFSILLSLKNSNSFIENISDLSGMSKSNPIISLSLAVIMLSMAGIPPFIGFFAKFYVFIAAINKDLIILPILGVLASVISAYYYLRIIKVMYFDKQKENLKFNFIISIESKIILSVLIIIKIFFIFYPSVLVNFASNIRI